MTSIVPVLLYHSISRRAHPRFARWVVSPERFESQLASLAVGGYTVVTASAVVEAARGHSTLPARAVAVTFDDGFADFRTTALPILRSFSYRCTLFPATAYLGGTSRWLSAEGEGDRPMLSWRDLVWLAEQGVEVGAHGHTHAMLDLLPPTRAGEDVARSRDALATALGGPVPTFAYPHGHSDRRTRRLVAAAGFRGAFGVGHAVANLGDDPYHLARLIVDNSVEDLTTFLPGPALAPARRAVRETAGRIWRGRLRGEQRSLAALTSPVLMDRETAE